MKRITLIFLFAVLLVSLIAGCNTAAENPSATPTAVPSTTAATPAPTQPTDDSGSTISLPLSDELVTFTAFWPIPAGALTYISSINEIKNMIELEKRTNIHIDAQQPAQGNEQEAFNLMIVSGDLKDLIWDRGIIGGPEKAVDDGYFLKLNDYLEEYLPLYNAVRTSDPNIMRDTTTDNGYVTAVFGIERDEPWPWAGLHVRKDWLDDLGLGIPVTYDDWEVMLTAFKEEKGAQNPMLLGENGNFMFAELSAAFGVNMAFFQRGGKVFYSPMESGYIEYLTLVRDWYGKGLIQPDFYAQRLWTTRNTLSFDGTTGATWGNPEFNGNNYVLNGVSSDPNLVYQAVEPPKLRASDGPANFTCQTIRTAQPFSIATSCSNPELLMKWLDYGYTEEGSLLHSFGVEGESLEFVNGKPQYTDLVVNNPDVPFTNNRWLYCTHTGPFLSYPYRHTRHTIGDTFAETQANTVAAQQIWSRSTDAYMLPLKLTRTAEEGAEFSALFSDIETLVSEMTLKVMLGQESVEAWGDVVEQINQMNISRVIEIQQAAMDRYYSR